MANLWKSFVEAIAPPQLGEQVQGEGVTLNHTVGGHPLSRREPTSSHVGESGFRAYPECREVCTDLNMNPIRETCNARVEGSDEDSDVEFQDSREALPPRSLADSIVLRFAPTTSVTNFAPSSTELVNDHHTSQISESGESLQVLDSEPGTGSISTADLIEDAKFYQDATIGYQDAYETLRVQQEELQHWYTQQAQLVEEASEAL